MVKMRLWDLSQAGGGQKWGGRGRASNLGIRDKSHKDDNPQLKTQWHHIFSFLVKGVRKQTWFSLFSILLRKGHKILKGQLHIPVHLQLNGFCDSELEFVSSCPPQLIWTRNPKQAWPVWGHLTFDYALSSLRLLRVLVLFTGEVVYID